tara:strand:- start:10414 stop:11832 length:1419 start_codon:yes stop_codon:yes gene_type:complete
MAQAESVAIPKRFPLVLQPENRNDTTQKDAKIINAFVEKGTSQGEHAVFSRPGLEAEGTEKTGTGLGTYNWLGDIYTIFGTHLYKNGTEVTADMGSGPIDTAGGVYWFSAILGSAPTLQFGNGAGSYLTDGTTYADIAGANFPTPPVKGWGYLDGTTYVMDALGVVYGSATLNDAADWSDVLNAIEAQIEPDAGVALSKQLVYIVAFKEWSTEIFYDAANATGSPLGPVQGAKLNFGCANQDSVQELDGMLFWVATNRTASPQVVKMDNMKLTVISTKPVDRLLGEADLSDVASFVIKYEGHKFYGITIKDSNITLVYDDAEDKWAQWTDPAGDYFPIVSSTYSVATGPILQHETNGKLYTFNAQVFTDDGEVLTADLYTPNFDGGVRRRKHLNMLEFIGDQVTGSVLQVRCNDSDYDPTKWTNFRQVNMGLKKPILSQCGTFIRRAYHIRHQSATPMRLMALEMQLDVGTL